MDSLTDFLKGPRGLGIACLLSQAPCWVVPVAFAGGADAHLLFMGAVAAITTGAHVVDWLQKKPTVKRKGEKNLIWVKVECLIGCLMYLEQQSVDLLANFLDV